MDKLTKIFQINHLKTSPYHPQTNAASERFNRTLIGYIRAFVNENTLDWESLLPVAKLSFNTQIHSATRQTPYYLTHFQDPKLPYLSLIKELPLYNDNWSNEALLRLNRVWKENQENLLKAQSLQKKYYDCLTRKKNF